MADASRRLCRRQLSDRVVQLSWSHRELTGTRGVTDALGQDDGRQPMSATGLVDVRKVPTVVTAIAHRVGDRCLPPRDALGTYPRDLTKPGQCRPILVSHANDCALTREMRDQRM